MIPTFIEAFIRILVTLIRAVKLSIARVADVNAVASRSALELTLRAFLLTH